MSKKFSIITLGILFSAMCLQVSASNLVNLDMKKTSDNSVDMNLYMTDGASKAIVTKKSDSKYVILIPNVSGKNVVAPSLSSVSDLVSNVDVKNVDDGMSGYTKITVNTYKPISIMTHSKKTGAVTVEESEAKNVIARVKKSSDVKTVSSEKPVKRVEVKKPEVVNNVDVKPVVKEQKQETNKVQKAEQKPKENRNINKVSTQIQTVANSVINNKQPEKKVEPLPPQKSEVAVDKQNVNQNISTLPTPTKQSSDKKVNWLVAICPFVLLLMMTRYVKNQFKKAPKAKTPTNIENVSEISINSEYPEIMEDKSLSWQDKYKKFNSKEDENSSITLIDKKRLELENTLNQVPEVYEPEPIELYPEAEEEIISEDNFIPKLKSFAKPASLSITHRKKGQKYIPQTFAKEGKFVKLMETPLNASARRFKDANLNVSDLINTGSKFILDLDGENMEQDYTLSSVEEYFSLLDQEEFEKSNSNLTDRVAKSLSNMNPSIKRGTNPISRSVIESPIKLQKHDYSKGLIIKESCVIDSVRSFHLVLMNGKNVLIGKIHEDVHVIKEFDSSVENLQVRPDGENVYIVKAGYFKSLVDITNMNVMIEL